MARKKEQSEAAEKAAEVTESQPAVVGEKPAADEPVTKSEFSVFDGDTLVRTYSIAEHGEKAYELANEFANKKGYRVR
jgi:hypothetical protein